MILVTGGTGMVGSHLLYFLVKENKQVRAIYRNSNNLELVKKVFSYYEVDFEPLYNKIDWQESELTDIPFLTSAFLDIDIVYHAAAFISFNPEHFSKLKKINVEGTANIVNLCLANNVKKMCYVSSVATLGTNKNNDLITEEAEWMPEEDNSVYAITKFGAEMEVWRGAQEGLHVVVVNPGVIFGKYPNGKGSSAIINLIAKKFPFYTLGGIGIVAVTDLVKIMIKLTNSSIKNERFIVVGENLVYEKLIGKLAKYLNLNPPKYSISKWKLMLFSKFDWFINKIFGTKRKLFAATVNSLYKESYFDNSKVRKTLDYSFEDIDETLKSVAENYFRESI